MGNVTIQIYGQALSAQGLKHGDIVSGALLEPSRKVKVIQNVYSRERVVLVPPTHYILLRPEKEPPTPQDLDAGDWDAPLGDKLSTGPSTQEVKLVVDGASGAPKLELQAALVLQEYYRLWKEKQRHYGPSNIAAMGKPGLIVRINDKVQRLKRFVFEGVEEDNQESELDSWLDILGYAMMGVMVHRGVWPNADPGVTVQQIERLLGELKRKA